jgi:hypothetical protein
VPAGEGAGEKIQVVYHNGSRRGASAGATTSMRNPGLWSKAARWLGRPGSTL